MRPSQPPPGVLNWFVWLPRRVVRGLIAVYQKTLSLDHGPLSKYFPFRICKYHPTCSEYGYQAISRFGVMKGGVLAVWRVMRCNPWSMGGYDPVPMA